MVAMVTHELVAIGYKGVVTIDMSHDLNMIYVIV